MIRLPINAQRASEETINALIDIGALYVDENGIHANDAGIYCTKENKPAKR